MKVTLDDIEPGDTVIAVLGAVGSGKSTFINAATESDVGGAPNDSFGEVQVSKCLISGTSTVFLEVPSCEELGKFLVFVSKWLEKASEMNLKISGVIYVHSINNINYALDSLPFLDSLDASCASSFRSIVLVTSMWGTGTNDIHSQRERQLITDNWKPILDRGSTAVRFLNTSPSALYILSNILPRCRGGTPASSIDPRYIQRIDAQPEDGHYPHVSLLAALIQASSFSVFVDSGVDVWNEAVRATLAIMNTPEVRLNPSAPVIMFTKQLQTSQGHRRLFCYIASYAAELLFAISEQVKAGMPYAEVADTVYNLNQRLLPLRKGPLPVRARRWPRSPQLALLKDCKLHIEATRQFFEEATLLGLQGVIDRIEARLAGRSLNEYEPSLTESQFSSLESFTSEYSRASVPHQDDGRSIPDLQHADRFLEVKYMAQTKGTLERLEALAISARLSIPFQSGPQTEGSIPQKMTVLQAHGFDRIAHLQQSINRVESFVKVGLANCAAAREPGSPKDTMSVVAPITAELASSNLRSSEKPPYPALPKLVFDARLLSHSSKNSPATPIRRKPNHTKIDQGSSRGSPVMHVDCTAYSPSLRTSFLKEDVSPLIQRQFIPSFSSLAPFIPEDSFTPTPTRWNPNLPPVDATLVNTSNPSLTSYTSQSHSNSITTHDKSEKLDVPRPFPSLGTPVSTSASDLVVNDANQPHIRTTPDGGSSPFSSLIGLYVDQLAETKEHFWHSCRETATVTIYVNQLLLVEGDHFHGAINGSSSVGGLGNVYYGMCHLR
ncbi:hypothetical protein PC9H_002613 [Pleurotus ostreatus]|uniref:G domain-containing protein n=1 Tax=Pleurotus ostreatus TaxID=5322 RepID=A0A8H6ZLW7_PLEOS|nr:uncharacterized protein PC9H_002613 [Pleurotus ostreatus]KAF7416348.1 hypothetical protein PC9H_002613 [Pleurotus ostreatus]